MKQLRSASEDEMVLAFLRAEIDSPRYGQAIAATLARSGLSRTNLIDRGDTENILQNDLRSRLLGAYRGYRGNALFNGFPARVEWSYVELDISDIAEMRYANYDELVQLSGESRRVQDGANRIAHTDVREGISEHARALCQLLKGGRPARLSELIAVVDARDNATPVLIEGHTRATAYVMAGITDPINAFLGSSASMRNWTFY